MVSSALSATTSTFLLILPIKLLVSSIGLKSTESSKSATSSSLLMNGLCRLFNLLLSKSLHSSCSLLFQLFWSHSSLCGLVHHSKTFLAFKLFQLNTFLRLNTKALLSVLDFLLTHFFSHNSKSLCSFLFLLLQLFELLKCIDCCCCSTATHLVITFAKSHSSELFFLLHS